MICLTRNISTSTMWQISREVSIWFVIHIIDLWWRAVLDRYFWRKDFIQELDLKVGENTRLACATCDILYRFPNRVKNSIASFVARASGSSSKEFVIIDNKKKIKSFLKPASWPIYASLHEECQYVQGRHWIWNNSLKPFNWVSGGFLSIFFGIVLLGGGGIEGIFSPEQKVWNHLHLLFQRDLCGKI